MSVLFRDRLTGASTSEPSPSPVLGEWQVVSPAGEAAFLNTIPIHEAAFLVPDGTARWEVVTESGERLEGTFPSSQLPDELDVEGILAIGGRLGERADGGASFLEWSCESPLVPRISERTRLTPLDRAIAEALGSLEDVCRMPRAHLRREIERLPVARARRIPYNATAYLASHTEDWECPTVLGVRPKRVLALIQEDQWDIYENRVAARLVDHLRAYLDRRTNELRRLAGILEQAVDHSSAVSKGTHWRRTRISKLWGDAFAADEGYRAVEKTLAQIRKLRTRVAGLMDSLLYREVPRKAEVQSTLRPTNVLANDPRYRRVAWLWEAWANQARARSKSPEEAHDEQQRLCRGFGDFCFLLVLRALDQAGYGPEDLEVALPRGVRTGVRGPYGDATIEWCKDGTILIQGARSLRVVPIVASMQGSLHEGELDAQIRRMELTAKDDALTLVLYPSPITVSAPGIGAASRRRLWSLGNDMRSPEARRLGFLPVSPWDIGSVERVARALRWVIIGPMFLAYPPVIQALPRWIDASSFSDWIKRDRDGRYQVLCRPSMQDVAWSRLEEERVARREELGVLEAHLEKHLQNRPLDDRRALADWNRQKQQLHREIEESKRTSEELERFWAQAQECFELIDALAHCPVCPTQGSARDFEVMDGGTFRRTCHGCNARWGTRICGACSVKYPFLRVELSEMQHHAHSAGWVDETIGSDVLAVPCPHGQFICPACGNEPCAVA